MARTGNGRSGDNGKSGRTGGPLSAEYKFIDRRLAVAEKGGFEEWEKANQDDLFTFVGEAVASDHKLSISFYSQGDCYIVSMTCNDERSPNWHCILTSRSNDLQEALALTLYKMFVLFDGKAWHSEDLRQNWG